MPSSNMAYRAPPAWPDAAYDLPTSLDVIWHGWQNGSLQRWRCPWREIASQIPFNPRHSSITKLTHPLDIHKFEGTTQAEYRCFHEPATLVCRTGRNRRFCGAGDLWSGRYLSDHSRLSGRGVSQELQQLIICGGFRGKLTSNSSTSGFLKTKKLMTCLQSPYMLGRSVWHHCTVLANDIEVKLHVPQIPGSVRTHPHSISKWRSREFTWKGIMYMFFPRCHPEKQLLSK